MSSSQHDREPDKKDRKDAEQKRRRRLEKALAEANSKYGRALKRLAEHPSPEEQRDER